MLLALVESIVPGCRGQGHFRGWAYTCTKNKLLDVRRAERSACRPFADLPSAKLQREVLEGAPGRPHGDAPQFARLTAGLNDRQASVVWLRGYCGLSVKAAALVLKVSPRSVEGWTRSALAALREHN